MVNFRKFENYFGIFRFKCLGPGSFSKILKCTFWLYVKIFIEQPNIKLRICHVLLKSEFLNRNNTCQLCLFLVIIILRE